MRLTSFRQLFANFRQFSEKFRQKSRNFRHISKNFRQSLKRLPHSDTFRLLNVNTRMPPKMNNTPPHDVHDKYSPKKNTPKSAAVSGSAKLSVTAADELTNRSPPKNSKYAILVVIMPMYNIGTKFCMLPIHVNPPIKASGTKNKAHKENVIATAGNVSALFVNCLLTFV